LVTPCNDQIGFDFFHHKAVLGDFKGGYITSDAGLLTLTELDGRLGWLQQAAQLLEDPRDPGKAKHSLLELLRQRVFGIQGGYEDCNDHDRMREDPALKLAAGRLPDQEDLASQPTLSRFENQVSACEVARMSRLFVQHFIDLHRDRAPREIVLDVDPTDDPCYGYQQLSLFNGHYGNRVYLPLLVFERTTGLLLGVRLRDGTAHGAKRMIQLIGPIVRELRKAFAGVDIIVRADAGVGAPRVYRWCEDHHLYYLIGIAINSVFEEETDWAVQWLSERHERDGEPCEHIGGFRHRAHSWKKARRILYRARVDGKGTDRRFAVTNLSGLPRHLYPRYQDRGTCETYIDQFKNGLNADRLSCSRFVANAFRLAQMALAYNLMRALTLMLAGTALEGASVETVRTRLLKIGALIRHTARRVWVHMASGFPLADVLRTVMVRIAALPSARPAPA
jgi:hypothetical protein